MTERRLLTARELGEALGLKPATILDKWQRGDIPGYQFGRAVRFDLDEILDAARRPSGGEEVPTAPRTRPARGVVLRLPTAPNRRRGRNA